MLFKQGMVRLTIPMEYPTITLAIFVRNAGACLLPFLRSIEAQTYPKKSLYLYIRSDDNIDGSDKVLINWIERNKSLYAGVNADCIARTVTSISNKIENDNHNWTPDRFSKIARLRQDSISFAIENKTHYFTVDADCFIYPEAIQDLLNTEKPVIGPLIALSYSNPHANYANFHHSVNETGYFLHSEEYFPIRNRVNPGIHKVDVIHCCYLIRNEVLQHVNYIDDSKRHEYVIFSEGLRKREISQFIDNRNISYLSWESMKDDLEKDELLLEYLVDKKYARKYEKWIVLTTINPPGNEILKYASFSDWRLCIVGDSETPHTLYHRLETEYDNVIYLSPEYQQTKYTELSNSIGWNCKERINCGFVDAYKKGAQIIAVITDDHMPSDDWEKNISVDRLVWCPVYKPINNSVFDPMSVTENKQTWHRGFPLELVSDKNKLYSHWGIVNCKIDSYVQDVDAICKISNIPANKGNNKGCKFPYSASVMSPFSSNLFVTRYIIPYYAHIPFIDRLGDIWGSYLLQYLNKELLPFIVYNNCKVNNSSNYSNSIEDLKKEFIGYKNTWNLIENIKDWKQKLDEINPRIGIFINAYQSLFPEKPLIKQIKTSVVIISRNDNYGGHLLERARYCLESMCRTMDEVIYIDWNSPDNISLTEALELQEKLPSNIVTIKVTSEMAKFALENRESQPCCEVLARNIGIRHARGEVIISSNIDIIPPAKEELNLFFQKWNNQTLYCTRRLNIDLDTVKSRVKNISTIQEDLKGYHKNQVGYWNDGISIVEACGDFQLAHRDLWHKVKGFNEKMIGRYYADSELQYRVKLKGYSVEEYSFPIYHIDHERCHTVVNNNRFQDPDPNKEDWGMLFENFYNCS